MDKQINATGGDPDKTQFLIPGSLYPTMTAQEEQQVAQQIVDDYKLTLGEFLTDNDTSDARVTALDILAMAKHLQNIAKFATDMLTNDALRQTNKMIDGYTLDDKGNHVEAGKQFEYHGNKWMLQIKETYIQLGYQHLPDGNLDPNSQTYHSLEVQQEEIKKQSKAITAQLNGLKTRILADHPKLQPTEIVVSLALKGQA